MNLGGFFRAQKTKWKIARSDRRWLRSERKQQLEAERDLPPRQLTNEESRLLRWLLENGSSEAQSFLPQLEGILAVRSCTCGCPSIRLVVAEKAPHGIDRFNILSDLIGETPRGELTGILLFQAGGKLAELEAYSLDEKILTGDSPEFGFPAVESLKAFALGDVSGANAS
ncbi:MAG: hypothetical protein P4L40_15630 [Terracidiphilus sp.]|nr:hypothetical protein [Terracidiphilus sp.]